MSEVHPSSGPGHPGAEDTTAATPAAGDTHRLPVDPEPGGAAGAEPGAPHAAAGGPYWQAAGSGGPYWQPPGGSWQPGGQWQQPGGPWQHGAGQWQQQAGGQPPYGAGQWQPGTTQWQPGTTQWPPHGEPGATWPAAGWQPGPGGAGDGQGPWYPPDPYWRPPAPPRRHTVRNVVIGLIVVVVLLCVGVVGLGIALVNGASPSFSGLGAGPGGLGSPSSSAPAPAPARSLNLAELAAKVNPTVVDVNTVLGLDGARGAGTGIVLDSSGDILTNNHVVNGATSIRVTSVGNGRTYTGTVLGYNRTEDVAVIKLTGASGLSAAAIGDSSAVRVGDPVAAIGNAGGTGGTPAIAGGAVTALGQSIVASDAANGSSEQLTDLIEVNADVQPGDSGGPLVNASGQVIGVDTAASAGFRFQQSGGQGYAIPIKKAMSIARDIMAGHASSTIHIGPTAFLGVEVSASHGGANQGAAIAGVVPNSPADQAGLAAGDTIVSLGGRSVDSPNTLTNLMSGYHPGDRVRVGWVDTSGTQHSAEVQLATGPVG